LHYDFRLELDGVLLSWAVPKGPSLDPGEKRLAVHVEDHPIEYATFEGIIPKGEYGGGTVLLWDRGRWEPIGDPRAGMRKGHLKFRLVGEKLRGVWNLVRLGRRDDEADDADNWMLLKERDDEARPEVDVTQALPDSVETGRTIEEVAQDADRVWSSTEGEIEVDPAARARARERMATRKRESHPPRGAIERVLAVAKPAAMPGFVVSFMIATGYLAITLCLPGISIVIKFGAAIVSLV
jgi:bifunctional non-homologous end joining protein LigD